jgi:hypothetical protein
MTIEHTVKVMSATAVIQIPKAEITADKVDSDLQDRKVW